MKSTERLLSKVDRAVGRLGVEAGSRILVGCSGGPDSTALLVALAELSARRNLVVTAAHVDHGIRGAGEREAELTQAQALCRSIGVPLATLSVEPGLLARQAHRGHRSLEETARTYRMAGLREAARRQRCSLIALGHTADDQVETMVMRFFQGSGARGLAGIRGRAGAVIRPLLACTREEVLRFLGSRGISCHMDSTNADRRFLRNRVRAELMPLLEEIFPGHRAALRSVCGKMTDLADLLDAELEGRDVWRGEAGGRFVADAAALRDLPSALRAESLYRVIDKVSPVRRRVPYRSVQTLAGADARPRRLSVPGARITLRRGQYIAERDIVQPDKRGYFSLVEPVASRSGSYRLSVEAQGVVSGRRSQEFQISGTGIREPVVLRSRRRGDRLRTAGGTRSLKEILSQWAVPLDARDDAAVVVDGGGTLAVIAWPWGARAAEGDGSRRPGSLSLTPMQENGAECVKQ